MPRDLDADAAKSFTFWTIVVLLLIIGAAIAAAKFGLIRDFTQAEDAQWHPYFGRGR